MIYRFEKGKGLGGEKRPQLSATTWRLNAEDLESERPDLGAHEHFRATLADKPRPRPLYWRKGLRREGNA